MDTAGDGTERLRQIGYSAISCFVAAEDWKASGGNGREYLGGFILRGLPRRLFIVLALDAP